MPHPRQLPAPRRLPAARAAAGAWLALLVLVALAAPWLPLPYPPATPDLAHLAAPPSAATRHWLGTDGQGLDVLTQLLFGARTAVLLTLPVAAGAAALGALTGAAAGFWGNASLRLPLPVGALAVAAVAAVAGAAALPWACTGLLLLLGAALTLAPALRRQSFPLPLDALLTGFGTLLDAVPRLVLVTVAAGLGASGRALPLLLLLTAWPETARLVRAQMGRVRILPFVEAARAAGLPPWRVWLRHALPHALLPLKTTFPLSVAGLLALESTLSFLGIGLPPDVASWGRMLNAAHLDVAAWWVFCPPLLALTGTTIALTLFKIKKQ